MTRSQETGGLEAPNGPQPLRETGRLGASNGRRPVVNRAGSPSQWITPLEKTIASPAPERDTHG